MRPDSSQGPDDRHGTRGGRGLSAASREGQAPESKKGVWISGWRAQSRERGGMQAEALEGQHTQQTPCPKCCYAVPLPARPWEPLQENWGPGDKLFPRHGWESKA